MNSRKKDLKSLNGEVMKIIDISEHNGNINWDKVKGNIDAVIIRAGYGQGNIDAYFKKNIQGAIDAEIKIGIYWFSYAYTTEMARREAQFCNDLIVPYKDKIILPVFFDWEYDSMNYAKKRGIICRKDLITEMNAVFCQRIVDLGFKAGYYLNLDYQKNYIDESKLHGYYKWFAFYNESLKGNKCDIWQFTSAGRVSGIIGNVDLDSSELTFIDEMPADEAGDETVEDDISDIIHDEEEYDMPLIKSGSKGKAVAMWQIIVDAKPDGVFGAETKKATEIFQKDHGLTVDGIVGPKSWKAGLASV